MWIVRLALRRPYTFVVMSILIVIMVTLAILRTPTDIFANIQQGIAQITAVSQTQLRQLPAGTTPPLILAYSASSVPVLQLALSGQNLSEQELNDYGLNFIRTQLITVPGASVPYPYGGK